MCVTEQSKAAENLKEMLYNAALEDNKKRHFTSAIHAHFREWLFGTVHLHGNRKSLLFSLFVYFFHFFLCPTNWVLVMQHLGTFVKFMTYKVKIEIQRPQTCICTSKVSVHFWSLHMKFFPMVIGFSTSALTSAQVSLAGRQRCRLTYQM